MKTTNVLINQIVVDIWPDETTIVGKTVTEEICLGVSEDNLHFVEAKGGSDFNATEIVQMLAQCATLVKICLDIWKMHVKKEKKDPSTEEVSEKLKNDHRVDKIRKDLVQFVPAIMSAIQRML